MHRTERRSKRVWVALGLVASAVFAVPAEISGTTTPRLVDGKTLFIQNCMACHSLNGVMVGPSLLEIAFLYKGNPEGIVAWSTEPGRKRHQMIPMPPMAHIGKPGLKSIADYILAATKGKKIGLDGVSKKKLSPPTGNIQRVLMPGSGPASIAVKLSDQMACCWDAGSCRLRYVWTGGFISHTWGSGFLGHQDGNDRRYSFEKAVLQGLPFYTSGKAFPMLLGGVESKPKYVGYRIGKNKRPHFIYTIHGVTIEESMSALPKDEGISRQFEIQGNRDPVTFTLTTQEGVAWSSDKGKWNGSILQLTAEEARQFSIAIVKTEGRDK